MADSVALAGSAFHFAGSAAARHRRLRGLTSQERQEEIELTVMLREKPAGVSTAQSLAWLQARPQRGPRHLSLDQVRRHHGFAAADRDQMARWARAHQVALVREDAATRRVTVRGTAAQLGQLFGVELGRYRWESEAGRSHEYRGHEGPVRLPAELAGTVTGVFGLDNRPIASPRLSTLGEGREALVTYDPPELAALYRYPPLPAGGDGLRLVAGMIELGGVTHAVDVAASFARLRLTPPDIVNVWLDGALPIPDPDGADVEVALDYQVLGAMVLAMAPRAQLTIVAYNVPNTERGFIDAVATAASDERRPAAVSISWGAPEDHWSIQGMRAMDAAFASGALHGVTYSAAAGDAGSANAETDGHQHAEFPASCPHVWACGGTTLLAVGGRVISETVWNELGVGGGAAGSGVSRTFPVPAYQAGNGIIPRSADDGRPGRGLPDGSGNADPLTGWNVVAQRRLRGTGGTSAVAPMYTALWTLVAALRRSPLGVPHAPLYRSRGRTFSDVTSGDTGGPYTAGRGWDLASGWGSPRGTEIARGLGVDSDQLRIPSTPESAGNLRRRREAPSLEVV